MPVNMTHHIGRNLLGSIRISLYLGKHFLNANTIVMFLMLDVASRGGGVIVNRQKTMLLIVDMLPAL